MRMRCYKRNFSKKNEPQSKSINRTEVPDSTPDFQNIKFYSKKKSIRKQSKHQIQLPPARGTSTEKKSLFDTSMLSCLWFQTMLLNNNYSHFSVTGPIFPSSFSSWNCNQWKRYWLYDPCTLVLCVCTLQMLPESFHLRRCIAMWL